MRINETQDDDVLAASAAARRELEAVFEVLVALGSTDDLRESTGALSAITARASERSTASWRAA